MAFRFVESRTRVGDGIVAFGGAKLFFFDFGTTDAKITHSDFARTVPNTDPVLADPDGLFPDIFLDIQADVTLKSSTDVVIYGPEGVFAPEDGITALAASAINVTDAAGDFTTDDLESVVTQLASDWARLNRINTFSAVQTFTDALQISDQELRRPLLLDYAVKHVVATSVAGVLTLDMSLGNSFVTTLFENISSIVITNPPATGNYGQFVLKEIQDGAGGAHTVAWASKFLFPGGTDPVMSTANDAIDEVTGRTIDAGTTYRCSFSQAFA